MWHALFSRLQTLFVAITFAEAGEADTARDIAYGPRQTRDDRPQA